MAEEEKKDTGKTTTVLVQEEEKKKGFPMRLALIYLLILATGFFLGILFASLLRS